MPSKRPSQGVQSACRKGARAVAVITKKFKYPPLHPEAQMNILMAWCELTRGRPSLNRKFILDQLWAMAAGLA